MELPMDDIRFIAHFPWKYPWMTPRKFNFFHGNPWNSKDGSQNWVAFHFFFCEIPMDGIINVKKNPWKYLWMTSPI